MSIASAYYQYCTQRDIAARAAKPVYCCAEHGHVEAKQMCANHGHLFDSLYPKSQYRCDACGQIHGTRPVNGAVNWQCMNPACPQTGAHQSYIGRLCMRCGELVEG